MGLHVGFRVALWDTVIPTGSGALLIKGYNRVRMDILMG